MRMVGLLLVALALCPACTSTTSPDEQCVVAGGSCFINGGTCYVPVQAACSTGYTCCTTQDINAYNVRDGGFFDAGPPPPAPIDGSADGAIDGKNEGATDAGASDAAHEAEASTRDAAHDASADAADATDSADATDATKDALTAD